MPTDPMASHLRDAATVHARRAHLKPFVDAVLMPLARDPLGEESTAGHLHRLADLLAGPEASAGREARSRNTQFVGGA